MKIIIRKPRKPVHSSDFEEVQIPLYVPEPYYPDPPKTQEKKEPRRVIDIEL